jgi:hypothetical protein
LSDHQIEDGSYIRIKDITFSYDFSGLLSKAKVKTTSFAFFVSVKNILTLTKYSGYDPEVNRFLDFRAVLVLIMEHTPHKNIFNRIKHYILMKKLQA